LKQSCNSVFDHSSGSSVTFWSWWNEGSSAEKHMAGSFFLHCYSLFVVWKKQNQN